MNKNITNTIIKNPIWFFVLSVFIFFSVSSEHFFDITNFHNIMVQTSTIGFIALGMTIVMINGNIDLSVGAVVALAASLAIDIQGWQMLETWGNWALLPSVLAALLAGVVLGVINGLVVWKTGVDAFIVTLGAMLGVRGLVFIYTKEQSFYASNFIFSDFAYDSFLGLPNLVWLFMISALIIHLLMTQTVHGRNSYAVGGNREAAINAGIKVGRHMMINFMIVGFFAALSGVCLSTQMGASTPNLGRDYELWAITVVVLGGTKLTGGVGNIVGTLGGVIAIGILRNGMNLMQVPPFYVYLILGMILIIVLILDKQINRKGKEELKL